MPIKKNKTSVNSLYLTYDGLIDPLGQSQILPYLEGLAALGHEITVISFEKASKEKIATLTYLQEESQINVIPLKYHKAPPVFSTVYDLYLLRKEVKKVLAAKNIDIIHCRSYITSLVGLWAKRKYGVKFVFDMRGFWADERVEGNIWSRSNPGFNQIYKYFKKMELEFIAESDSIISLTYNAKQEMLSWKNGILNDEKVSVIPTCANFSLFDPKSIADESAAQLRADLDIRKDDFVLLYLGSLGTWYMLNEMLDFFKVLKAEKSKRDINAKFLFVTRDKEILQNALSIKDLSDKDIIITQSSRENVPIYISLCNVGVFFILPTFSKKASAATKMGEILAMGKPVVTNTGWGDVDTILKDSSNGILVSSLDGQGYQKTIEEFENRTFNAVTIRRNAENYFSLESGVESYHETYLKLLEKRQ